MANQNTMIAWNFRRVHCFACQHVPDLFSRVLPGRGGRPAALSLIHNERVKLLALAFNTAATSSFTVGVLAPVAAAFYDFGSSREAPRTVVVGAILWITASVVLHLAGRRVLGWLKT